MNNQLLSRFILASDLHLTGTRPAARRDEDWESAQADALAFIVSQANDRKCPLVLTGDIYDHPVVSTRIVNMSIRELKKAGYGVFIIPGNHELPFHRWEDVEKSSIGTLLSFFSLIPQINGAQDAAPFGRDVDTGARIVFTHQLVFPDDGSKPPMAKGKTATELLEAFPKAQWIFTGDFHGSFHVVESGRHVVNPGNMIAHNASMIETEAVCAFVDLDSETVEWIPIPDDPDMLSREHLEAVEQRESRVAAFLERVGDAEGVCLTFADRLEARMQGTDIPETVHQAYLEVRGKATKEEK